MFSLRNIWKNVLKKVKVIIYKWLDYRRAIQSERALLLYKEKMLF